DHAEELARPDLYQVALEGGIGMRLAPTDHGAISEFDFPTALEHPQLLLEGVDEHCRIDAAGAVLDGRLRGWVDSAVAQGYDHAEELARPDLYQVALEGGIGMRLAPTDHGAISEFDFPTALEHPQLLLEGVDEHCRIDAAGAVLDGRLRGWVDSAVAQGYDR